MVLVESKTTGIRIFWTEFMRLQVLNKCLMALFFSSLLLVSPLLCSAEPSRQTIKALYIPFADYYSVLLAYERNREQMYFAQFQLQQMKNWDLN